MMHRKKYVVTFRHPLQSRKEKGEGEEIKHLVHSLSVSHFGIVAAKSRDFHLFSRPHLSPQRHWHTSTSVASFMAQVVQQSVAETSEAGPSPLLFSQSSSDNGSRALFRACLVCRGRSHRWT